MTSKQRFREEPEQERENGRSRNDKHEVGHEDQIARSPSECDHEMRRRLEKIDEKLVLEVRTKLRGRIGKHLSEISERIAGHSMELKAIADQLRLSPDRLSELRGPALKHVQDLRADAARLNDLLEGSRLTRVVDLLVRSRTESSEPLSARDLPIVDVEILKSLGLRERIDDLVVKFLEAYAAGRQLSLASLLSATESQLEVLESLIADANEEDERTAVKLEVGYCIGGGLATIGIDLALLIGSGGISVGGTVVSIIAGGALLLNASNKMPGEDSHSLGELD